MNAPSLLTPELPLNSSSAQADLDVLIAGEIDTAMHKLSRHLRMVHASDNRGHYDDHLPPGQGAIDWPRILGRLRDSGFRGSIMMEIAGRGEPAQILDAARRARQFLRRTAWRLG